LVIAGLDPAIHRLAICKIGRPTWVKGREVEIKMLKLRILPLLVVAAFALLVPQAPAHAQARSWVSGTGNDTNPCSRALPCKNFAGALAKTAAGGEIFALDGGEYDGLTINKAITIDGGSQNASVHTTDGSAIFVSANPSDVVIIRNLHVRGSGNPNGAGATGIFFASGALLSIEGCTISGTASVGISATLLGNGASATLNVFNTTIIDAGIGIDAGQPAGSGGIFGQVDHVTIQRETSGLGGIGIQAIRQVVFTVTNSNILNAQVAGIDAESGAVVNVDLSSVSSNNTAFAASGGTIRVSRSSIYDNNTNFSMSFGGVIATDGDNDGAINGTTMPNGTVSRF
jgi:hypothetical protein